MEPCRPKLPGRTLWQIFHLFFSPFSGTFYNLQSQIFPKWRTRAREIYQERQNVRFYYAWNSVRFAKVKFAARAFRMCTSYNNDNSSKFVWIRFLCTEIKYFRMIPSHYAITPSPLSFPIFIHTFYWAGIVRYILLYCYSYMAIMALPRFSISYLFRTTYVHFSFVP